MPLYSQRQREKVVTPLRLFSYIQFDIVNVNIIRWTLLCDTSIMRVGYMLGVTQLYYSHVGLMVRNIYIPVQGNLV